MTKQLSFFEMVGATVLDAAQHKKNVQENKRKAAQETNKKKRAINDLIQGLDVEERQPKKELAPTWEIIFFDADLAERMAWYRAEDEDNALSKCKKAYKGVKVVRVRKSDRSLEEIEALD